MDPPTRPQNLIVLGFGLGQIVAFASSFYLMGAIGDAVARDLSLPPALVFGTVSLSLAVPAVIAPAVARRIDRSGGRWALLASHVVFACGLATVALSQDGLALAAGMAVIGLGMALGLSPTPFAILVALYGQAARRPITGVALIGGLGSAIGWPLTAAFAEAFGWRGACLAWAGVQLALCLPLSAWICPRTPGQAPHPDGPAAPARWDRPMAQLAVLFACAWFISTCMSAHLPRLLAGFGLSMPAATAAASLMGLAAVAVRFLEFTVLRKLPPLATTRVATLAHPAGAAALLGLGAPGAAAMAIGQGAANGMLTVAKGVLPLHLWGAAGYATRSALIGRPALVAQVFGPAAYALLIERSAALALLASSVLCLVMLAMTFGLAARPQPHTEPAIA